MATKKKPPTGFSDWKPPKSPSKKEKKMVASITPKLKAAAASYNARHVDKDKRNAASGKTRKVPGGKMMS